MKKIFYVLCSLFLFVLPYESVAQEKVGSAIVSDVSTTVNGSTGTVKLTVTIKPTFTPAKSGYFEFVVSPVGPMRHILNSTVKRKIAEYNARGWDTIQVDFECDLENNSISQCRTQDFCVEVYKN